MLTTLAHLVFDQGTDINHERAGSFVARWRCRKLIALGLKLNNEAVLLCALALPKTCS